MSVVCPACHHINPPQTLVCSNCHSVMSLVGGGKTSIIGPAATRAGTVRRDKITQTAALRVHRQEKAIDLSENQIAIFVDRSETPHLIENATEIIFGRPAPDQPASNETQFDLAPFQGYEKGVSRKHAVLRRKDGLLMLEDLGSSNGTSLNEERLSPYIQKSVQSGDRIRLGSLVLEIYVGTAPNGETAQKSIEPQESPFASD